MAYTIAGPLFRPLSCRLSPATPSVGLCHYIARAVDKGSRHHFAARRRLSFHTTLTSTDTMAPGIINNSSANGHGTTSMGVKSACPEMPSTFAHTPLPNVTAPIDKNARMMAAVAASRDLRSDTVTTPTESMGEAMAGAAGYDNVFGDDVVSNNFEASVAALFGKEAGLYVTSGTLSNQLCLRTWLMQPPYSILCDARSHIHKYEAGGCAFHSGAALELVHPSNGLYLRWEQDVKPRIVPDDGNVHSAPTAIVSLENTLNGVIMPQEEVERIAEGVRAANSDIKLHLDGARIWNVAAKTGMSLKELCKPFDSISVCFSKGLGAPVGSMMLGPQRFIKKATHFRKLFGGGMRQSAPLTAAAKVAYEEHFAKLPATHDLAMWLASQLRAEGVEIMLPVDTNMLFIDVEKAGISGDELEARARALPKPIQMWRSRLVIHHQIDPSALDDIVGLVRELKAQTKPSGPVPASKSVY